MPDLTDEQVAAYPEIVEAADRLAQELTSGMAAHLCPSCGGRDAHGRYCNVARLEAALAAAEPKVPTLVEAAQKLYDEVQSAYVAGHQCLWCGHGENHDHLFPCPMANIQSAIRAEREAQAAACVLPDATNTIGAEAPPEPVADYGEPVHYNFGAGHHQLYTRHGSEADGTRQMQCFNALAGCHPGELGELVRLSRVVASYENMSTPVPPASIARLAKALTAFKPETKT